MRRAPVYVGWFLSAGTYMLALCYYSAVAAEPRASLRGPSTTTVGETVLLSVTGTVADEEPVVKLAEGPSPVDVSPLYTREQKLAYGMLAAQEPGEYWFVCMARGTPEGASKPTEDFALWRVVVRPREGPQPPPQPTPTPDPEAQEDPPPATPLGFSRAAWEAKGSYLGPRDIRDRQGRAIADGYVQACSNPGLTTAEAVKQATHRAAWAALGRDEAAWGAWRPVFARMVEALNSWAADLGRLPTAEEMRAVYLEIADGYRRAKR